MKGSKVPIRHSYDCPPRLASHPLTFGRSHLDEFRRITVEIKAESKCFHASFCNPQQEKILETSKETHVIFSADKNKPTFFIISIYVRGCNIRYNLHCNTSNKDELREHLRAWRKNNGYLKSKKK